MTEFSGLWTTTGAPSGDQQVSYTQAQLSIAFSILAGCANFEGIAANYRSDLNPTDGGANTCNIAAGGAMSDGKYYDNTATVGVNIPSASGGGNTRIDRVVIRADWSAFTLRIFRIAGVDAGTPSVPAIVQTTGTTYDIKIAQVLVDTGGSLTVTDERIWAITAVDNSTIQNNVGTLQVKDAGIVNAKIGPLAVDTAEIAAHAVDDEKAGEGVFKMIDRHGGSSSEWDVDGVSEYVPALIKLEAGSANIPSLGPGATTTISPAFRVGFNGTPLVFAIVHSRQSGIESFSCVTKGANAEDFAVEVTSHESSSTLTTGSLHWLAIGGRAF